MSHMPLKHWDFVWQNAKCQHGDLSSNLLQTFWTLEDESWNLETTHCLPALPQYLHLQWTFCSQIDHAIYKSELSTELSAVSSNLTTATLPAAHQQVRSYSNTVAVKMPDTLYHNLYNMLYNVWNCMLYNNVLY